MADESNKAERAARRLERLPEFLRVPWGIKQCLVVFLGAWLVLPVVAIVLLRIVAPVLPAAGSLLNGLRSGAPEASFILALVNVVAALLLVAFFLRRYRVGWEAVGWRKFSVWRALAYLIVIFVVFTAGAALLLQLVQWLDPNFNPNQPQQNEFIGSIGTHPLLALLALVVFPPVIEETVFRGFVFPALAKRWGLIGGALGSSVLFGLAHFQANVTIYTFLLGLLLCFMYVRLKSIVPGIALHMLNNLLAYLVLASGGR